MSRWRRSPAGCSEVREGDAGGVLRVGDDGGKRRPARPPRCQETRSAPPPYDGGGVTHPYAAKSILSLSIADTPRLGHVKL